MKKISIFFLLILIVSIALFIISMGPRDDDALTGDISNLKIKDSSCYCNSLSFEDAVKLKAKLNNLSHEIAEKQLRDLERELSDATGGSPAYYQVVGAFTFPGIEGLDGELSTLVVAADGEDPSIYAVELPMTEVLSAQNSVQWTQMDSSCSIAADETSVRLAAMGYLTVSDGGASAPDRLSNTLYPTFTFSLSDTPD